MARACLRASTAGCVVSVSFSSELDTRLGLIGSAGRDDELPSYLLSSDAPREA